jgi:hypothetical protein
MHTEQGAEGTNLEENSLDAMTPPGDIALLLSDDALHGWLGRESLKGDSRIAMERELRHREGWSAPAGRALKVSIWALAVSALALIVSAVALWVRNSN